MIGSEEYRYDSDPSTRPMLPRVYDVAKLCDAREETLIRRPRGVSKETRACLMLLAYHYGAGTMDMPYIEHWLSRTNMSCPHSSLKLRKRLAGHSP